MTPWLEALQNRPASAGDAMLVTVLSVRGSAPREPGARMLVDLEGITGTIGGGILEHRCAKLACDILGEVEPGRWTALTHRFPLGPGMGQCCGGVVEVLFERVNVNMKWIHDLLECHEQRQAAVIATEPPVDGRCTKLVVTADRVRVHEFPMERTHPVVELARRLLAERGSSRLVEATAPDGSKFRLLLEPFGVPGMSIALFGAGHVGSAVVAAMASLDCEIRWIDGRRGVFPAAVPGNVQVIESGEPVREIAAMPPGAFYLVMTHSHPLDFEICEAALRRDDFAYVGLIGSRTKRRRFEQRMKEAGLPPAQLERLTCPMGIDGVGGKRPAEIAIAVAAELLQIQAVRTALHAGPAETTGNVHVLRRR